MKSHPIAPVFAMALLLAILMWLCSSCEKKPVYTGKGKVDDLMRKLDSASNVGYLDTALPFWTLGDTVFSEQGDAGPYPEDKLTEEERNTKFLNIPPNQRAAMLRHAEEGLIYWKTKYTPQKHHFEQNPLGAPHSTYRFTGAEAIYFFNEKEFKAEFYCYVGEQDDKDQTVIIDVTKEQWVKDIFNKFYNAKKE